MTDVDVNVGSSAESWGNVVNPVVHVLVNAGLETEWAYDAWIAMLLASLDEFLSKLVYLIQRIINSITDYST